MPFNSDPTIISEYANSPITKNLIAYANVELSPDPLFESFYDLIWNIDTAVGYGLDIWGRIVGVVRTVTLIDIENIYLGFEGPDGGSGDALNVGIFYAGESLATTQNYELTDDTFRNLILAKAAANITDGAIPSINQILLNLFPNRGVCYVTDNQDMTITYTFLFLLYPYELAIITTSGVLPTPGGVRALISYPGLIQ